jgi:hypothetical protein
MPSCPDKVLFSLNLNVPSSSRRTWDGEGTTRQQQHGAVAFVAAARFLGGQFFPSAIQTDALLLAAQSFCFYAW